MKKRILWGLASAVLLVTCTHTLNAHSISYAAFSTELHAEDNSIVLHTEIPWDVRDFINLENQSEENKLAFYSSYFLKNLQIKQHGQPCEVSITSLQVVEDRKVLDGKKSIFDGRYLCNSVIPDLTVLTITHSLFAEEFIQVDHFVNFSIGKAEWELLFTKDKTEYPETVKAEYYATPLARFEAVFAEFTWMGMKHIFTGYDHILFLLSIILLVRSIKKILLFVTSFTLAHSITLILASFNVVKVSPSLVEPIIAFSIAYMAWQNIQTLRKDHMQFRHTERWITIFGFGLIHGVGFASVLSETQIPEKFFIPALLFFNVGIEVGQLMILAIIVPILFSLDRSPYARQILLVCSGGILILALLWFLQRVFA